MHGPLVLLKTTLTFASLTRRLDAKDKFDAVLANADWAYAGLTDAPRGSKGSVTWHDTAAQAAQGAQLIIGISAGTARHQARSVCRN